MQKLLAYLLLLTLVLSTQCAIAQEPKNLALIKQGLIRYHDSGEYQKDIDKVIIQATRYLEMYLAHIPPHGKKPVIVLDIDETAISNYPKMVKLNFGGTREQMRQSEEDCKDAVIAPTLKLYRYAKRHGVTVFFITGRHESERETTIKNLQDAGYIDWDGLILRSKDDEAKPAAEYKIAMRKQLNEQGYEIILNIGDQKSDLTGSYAKKAFKLPNPYYLIP